MLKKSPCGMRIATEQHRWSIFVSDGNNWEYYDSIHTWTRSRRHLAKKIADYPQFQAYLRNTGRKYKIEWHSVEKFPHRPIYLDVRDLRHYVD